MNVNWPILYPGVHIFEKKNCPISSISYVYKFYLCASHYLSCVWKYIYSWMVSFIIEYYNIASINLFFVYYNYSMLIPFLKCNIMLYTYVILSFFDTFFSFNFFFILCFANIYIKLNNINPFLKIVLLVISGIKKL